MRFLYLNGLRQDCGPGSSQGRFHSPMTLLPSHSTKRATILARELVPFSPSMGSSSLPFLVVVHGLTKIDQKLLVITRDEPSLAQPSQVQKTVALALVRNSSLIILSTTTGELFSHCLPAARAWTSTQSTLPAEALGRSFG